MIEALKAKYTRKARRNGVVCFLIGLAITLFLFKDWLPIGQVQNLDTVRTMDEIHEGRATLTVAYIYDYFMYYTEGYSDDERTAVARDYFVLCGLDLDAEEVEQDVYIGVELEGKRNRRAYKLMDDIWSSENFDWSTADVIRTKGHVEKMDDDELQYWNEYIAEGAYELGMSVDELKQYFSPYIYRPNSIFTYNNEHVYSYLAAAFGIVFLVMGIVNLIQGFFGNPLKDLERYGKRHGGEDAAIMKAEMLYEKCTPRYGIVADDDMFIFDNGSKLVVEDTRDVLWAYEKVVTRKSNFVTVGKDYFVCIRTIDGKSHQIACKQEEVHTILSAIHDVCPDLVFGFSKDIEREYNRNRQSMMNEVLRRRESRLSNNNFENVSADSTDSSTNSTEAVNATKPAFDGFSNEPFDGFSNEPFDGFSNEPFDGFSNEPFDGFSNDPMERFETKAQNETTGTENYPGSKYSYDEPATENIAGAEQTKEADSESKADNDKMSGFFS